MWRKVRECKNCNYYKAVRKGRAWLVCAKCGRDLTLEMVLLYEIGVRFDKPKKTDRKKVKPFVLLDSNKNS